MCTTKKIIVESSNCGLHFIRYSVNSSKGILAVLNTPLVSKLVLVGIVTMELSSPSTDAFTTMEGALGVHGVFWMNDSRARSSILINFCLRSRGEVAAFSET